MVVSSAAARVMARALVAVLMMVAGSAALAQTTAAESPDQRVVPVVELPRGWVPQTPVRSDTPWWHLGVRATAQAIGNPLGGQQQIINLANAVDLISTLGLGIGVKPLRTESDRWTLNTHLTGYVETGAFVQQLGLVNADFQPQNAAQSPSGVWMQSLWIERIGAPGEWLQSLKVGDVTINPTFFTPPAGMVYVSNVFNGNSGIQTTGYPTGPVNGLGALATLVFGRSRFDVGAFQLSSQRADPNWLGFSQALGPQDGLLQVLQWQTSLGPNQQPGCLRDRPSPREQSRFRTRTGCANDRLLQNQLPDAMLRLGLYSGSWSFAGVNGPSLNGLAPAPGLSGGSRNSGTYGYLAVPLASRSRLWLNGSWGLDPAVNPFPGFLAIGLVQQGLLRSRPQDLLIVGVANAWASPAFTPAQGNQGFIELGYQLQLSRRLSLQPFSQLLLNPGGATAPSVLTFGVQVDWSL